VRLARQRDRVVALGERSQRATLALLVQRKARLERAGGLLLAFSYREVLKRGFALVRDGEGRPLRSAAAVTGRMRMEIEFSDGRVGAVADGEAPTTPTAASRAKPRPRGGQGSGGQGSLFGA
jgi:exodeoxyribonuclease VII large subunit